MVASRGGGGKRWQLPEEGERDGGPLEGGKDSRNKARRTYVSITQVYTEGTALP